MIPNPLLLLLFFILFLSSHKNLLAMDLIEQLSLPERSSEEHLPNTEKYSIDRTFLVQVVTDLISTRTFGKNVKLYNVMKENKNTLGILYTQFKKGVIKQGARLSSLRISEQQWEKNRQLMKAVLAKKIIQSTQLTLSQGTLKEEIKQLSEKQQMHVFAGFSSPFSLRSIYLAFSHLENGKHDEIKKALIDHIILIAQESITQKLPTIGFIFVSIALWCTHHKFPKRVQEVLTPLYQLLAITIFGAKTF
jgi:hypothetical protein